MQTRSQKRKQDEELAEVQKRQKAEEEQKLLESKKINVKQLPADVWHHIGKFIPPVEYSNFIRMTGLNPTIMSFQVKSIIWTEKTLMDYICKVPANWDNKEWKRALYLYTRMVLKLNIMPVSADLIRYVLTFPHSGKITKTISMITSAINDFQKHRNEQKEPLGEEFGNKINEFIGIFTKQYALTDNFSLQMAARVIKLKSLSSIPTFDDVKQCMNVCMQTRTGGVYASSLVVAMIRMNPEIARAVTTVDLLAYRTIVVQPIIIVLLSYRPDLIDDQLFIDFLGAGCIRACLYMDDKAPSTTDASKTARIDECLRRNSKVVFGALLEKKYQPSLPLIDNVFTTCNSEMARQLLKHNVLPAADILSRIHISPMINEAIEILLAKNYQITVRTVASAVEFGNLYAINIMYRNFHSWDPAQRTFIPVLTAIQRSQVHILDRLLEFGWEIPPPASLIVIWKVTFDLDIFECLIKHIARRNLHIKSNNIQKQLYTFPMHEMNELIICTGIFDIMKLLIEAKLLDVSDNWIRSLRNRGAYDIADKLQAYLNANATAVVNSKAKK